MIKRLLWLVFSFYTAVLLAQQPETPEQNHSARSTPLSEQITAIERTLKQLQNAPSSLPDVETQKLLAKMPISTDTISHQMHALGDIENTAITKQLQQVNRLSSELIKVRNTIIAEQQYLKKQSNLLGKNKKTVNTLKQFLDNPLNREQLDEADEQKILYFSQNINKLENQYNQLKNHSDEQLKSLENAIELLNRWENALSTAQLESATIDTEDNSEKNRLIDLQKRYSNEAKTLINELNKERGSAELADIEKLQQAIYQKQTMAWLVGADISLANIVNKNVTLADDITQIPLNRLKEQHIQVNHALTQLKNLRADVEAHFSEFQKYVNINGANPELDDAFTKRLKAIAFQHLQLNNKPAQLSQRISQQQQHALLTRDDFFTKATLGVRPSDIYESLVQIGYQIKISFTTLTQQVLQNPYRTIALAIAGMALLFLFAYATSRWFSRPLQKRENRLGTTSGFRIFLLMLKRYRYFLIFLLFIVMLVRVSGVPYPSGGIIRTLVYGLAIGVIWLEYSALPKYRSKRDMLAPLLLVPIALLYVLAKLSSVAPALVLIYEKLLMLAMMGFVWMIRRNLLRYLAQRQGKINSKVYSIYLSVTQGLPWLIVGVCILNLVGYNQLSWMILAYLGVGILYYLVLLFGLAMVDQLRKQLKLYCLHRFANGAIIGQDIITPVSTLTKVLWLWAATAGLFKVMGWNSSSYLINKVLTVFNYPLLTFEKTSVTLLTISLLILAIYLIFRLAKWLKAFSYHWLYAKIGDLGVRNSLAIFTQYVMILSGVLITMNVLGIDLTSLAVFAGALGVGVGLGLQDIAKNFISGILLLIERPLRTDDWVDIDGNSGRVKSIGMRAITVETFNNQEVIIPNGNAIGNSFTNYTHSNSLIRTVLYIGAGYSCDPELVIQTLKNILQANEDVLENPPSKVVMWEYADSSINYRIQYFINMENSGRWETKTEILKSIWYEFKANDIEIPFPQRDINFRNLLQNERLVPSNDKEED